MKQWVKAWMLIAAVTLAGCQNGGVEVSRLPPRPVDQVDNVALRLSPPMPLNWDDAPGLDGLQAQLNLFQLDQPLSVIVEGAMEFVLYEGRGTAQVLAGKKPFRVWTFQGPELRNCMGKTMFGGAMRCAWTGAIGRRKARASPWWPDIGRFEARTCRPAPSTWQ